MKITIIALHYAEYSFRLAAALSSRHAVLLFLYLDNALNDMGYLPEPSLFNGNLRVVLVRRPKSVGDVLRNARQLIAETRSFGPDVIHYQEAFRDEIAAAWPFMPKAPSILTVHDPVPHSGEDAQGLRWSRGRAYRFAFRRWADHVITHGKFLTKELLRESPHLSGKVSEVAHGVLGTVGDLPVDSALPPRRLLFFGRLYKYKGLSRFVDAVISLRGNGLDVVGVVAGRGPDLGPNLVKMKSSDCFELVDRFIAVDELPRLFGGTRAAVLPYLDGTQSGVSAMAFGYGRPVICTAVGSIPEVVHDGINGLVVDPKDDVGLVDAMRRVLLDDSLWMRLADGARQSAQGPLGWTQIGLDTERVYRSLLPASVG